MKNRIFKFVIMPALALTLVMTSGCAYYATRGGVITPVGALTITSLQVEGGRKTVGSYAVILGLFTFGYKGFLQQTEGKEIDIIDTNFWVYRGITAVER